MTEVSVSVRCQPRKYGNRHLNRHQVDARKAGGLENSGAVKGIEPSLSAWEAASGFFRPKADFRKIRAAHNGIVFERAA